MSAKTKANEIQITRIYDAPVSLVWAAWTDPKQVAQWWGPRGFSITTHRWDLRPGGSWTYTMHGPDGVDYPNVTQYHEVEKEAKLVYDHGATEDRPPLFRVTVRFTEIDGKTKMEMTSILPSAEVAVEMRKFIKQAGGDSTWDRLAEYLEKNTSGQEKFVVTRSFAAPLESLFDLWSNPKHLAQWLPPTGFTMQFIECDIRAGGGSFYAMANADGSKMYGLTQYLAIERPHRIIYTQQFADEKKQVIRHPMSPTWPESMRTTVTFVAEDENRTRVTVTWEPDRSATPAEVETFIKSRSGMTQGWNGSFDKLETYISEI